MLTWSELKKYQIETPAQAQVFTQDQAAAFAAQHAGPVCLKVVGNMHKGAAGLVMLGVTRESVATAWIELERRARAAEVGPPFLLQEQLSAGLEFLVGGRRDSAFGPLVIFGLGGRLADLADRWTARMAPLDRFTAIQMVSEIANSILPPQEASSLADVIEGVSRLLLEHPEISELDLNPVLVSGGRAVAVDLRSFDAPSPSQNSDGEPLIPAREAIRLLLSPRSVVILGASNDPTKLGSLALANLMKRRGDRSVHAVNPRGGLIDELPAFAEVKDLPDHVDVAVVAVPKQHVLSSLEACAAHGIRAAIVFASGYAEANDFASETEIQELARRLPVRVCGVNTTGVMGDVPLTFSHAVGEHQLDGGVSYITQSGAMGGSLLVRSWELGLGTSRFICVGNQTDLTIPDYLDYLADDQRTTTVGLFLEGARDGRALIDSVRRVKQAGKGVAVLKAGGSMVGSIAAKSHTAAIAGSDQVYKALLSRAGAVLTDDIPELVAACQALDWQGNAAGDRVAVISTSGGACSLLADLLARRGLQIPELEASVQASLREILPAFATTRNPLDTTAQVVRDPGFLRRMAEPVLDSERVDILLVALTTLMGESALMLARDISDLGRRTPKPIVVAWTLPEGAVPGAYHLLRQAHIPVFDSMRLACVAVAAVAWPPKRTSGHPERQPVDLQITELDQT